MLLEKSAPPINGVTVIPKVNLFALLIGPPAHGKTSLAAELARGRLEAGRWVLAQDTNHEMTHLCARYETSQEFLRALARASESGEAIPAGAAFPCAGDQGADELLTLAVELGEQWNRAAGGTRKPICVIVNEAYRVRGRRLDVSRQASKRGAQPAPTSRPRARVLPHPTVDAAAAGL